MRNLQSSGRQMPNIRSLGQESFKGPLQQQN